MGISVSYLIVGGIVGIVGIFLCWFYWDWFCDLQCWSWFSSRQSDDSEYKILEENKKTKQKTDEVSSKKTRKHQEEQRGDFISNEKTDEDRSKTKKIQIDQVIPFEKPTTTTPLIQRRVEDQYSGMDMTEDYTLYDVKLSMWNLWLDSFVVSQIGNREEPAKELKGWLNQLKEKATNEHQLDKIFLTYRDGKEDLQLQISVQFWLEKIQFCGDVVDAIKIYFASKSIAMTVKNPGGHRAVTDFQRQPLDF